MNASSSNRRVLDADIIAPVQRDPAIDIIRGYCIVSMVTAHVAAFSWLAKVLHVFPKFDGASGFVLLGGLVLGMVQHRRAVAQGIVAVRRKSLRRIAMIYGAQLMLIGLGLVAAYSGWETANLPNLEGLPPFLVVLHSLLMTLAPPGGDVLRLYVFMLLLAIGCYQLLLRGRWVTVLAASLVIHIIGQLFPELTSFSPFADQAPSAGWAGWQFLFLSSLVLGWYWEEHKAAAWLDAHAVWVFTSCVGIVALAAICSLIAPEEVDEFLFSKYTFPLGRTLVAYAVVAAMYVALRWLQKMVPLGLFRPLAVIGKRSLDSYVIQAVVVVLAFGFTTMESTSGAAQLTAVATLLVCWAWAELRTYRDSQRRKARSARQVSTERTP